MDFRWPGIMNPGVESKHLKERNRSAHAKVDIRIINKLNARYIPPKML